MCRLQPTEVDFACSPRVNCVYLFLNFGFCLNRVVLSICKQHLKLFKNIIHNYILFFVLSPFKMLVRLSSHSGSILGLKSLLKIPGLEPGTSRPSMLSECAYHLRYIPVEPSTQTHSITGPDLAGHTGLAQLFFHFIYKKI